MTDALPTGEFRAFRLREDGDGGELVELSLDDLDPGEVTLRAEYSSVNYKDALAGTGRGRIARRLPLVGRHRRRRHGRRLGDRTVPARPARAGDRLRAVRGP
ncbi:MAG: hypothetical protein U5K33_02500 [Halofilum sp. (in: g-proteobacteria)]|nr:hypothetical protein [Halofilum sp. (in: g-proteobacteria)]